MKMYYALSLEELKEKYGKEFKVDEYGNCWLDSVKGYIDSTDVQYLGQVHNLRTYCYGNAKHYFFTNVNWFPKWACVEVPPGIFEEL